MGKVLFNSWTSDCQIYDGDNNNNENNENGNENNDASNYSAAFEQCVANAAVYRPTFVATLFFLTSAVATYSNPRLNKEAWPAKFGIYIILLVIFTWVPNAPILAPFFVVLFRIGAMIFIFIQQVILIDIAYNWNEALVLRADEADNEEWGSGKKWLQFIIACSIGLYAASFTGIGLLYKYFGGHGCAGNIWVITITLLQIIGVSVLQLFFSEEGSTLTTSVLSAYSTYLAYSTLTKNPDGHCNPTLGSEDVSGIVIGLCLTMLSLAWTGWSWTAESRIDSVNSLEATNSLSSTANATANANGNTAVSRMSQSANLNLDVPFLDPSERPTTGVVMNSGEGGVGGGQDDYEFDDAFDSSSSSSLWKLNVIMALISCWVAASLTGWGSVTAYTDAGADHSAANPLVGRLNMAMIAVSQNIAILLYLWTLIAPMLFPDRDFS